MEIQWQAVVEQLKQQVGDQFLQIAMLRATNQELERKLKEMGWEDKPKMVEMKKAVKKEA